MISPSTNNSGSSGIEKIPKKINGPPNKKQLNKNRLNIDFNQINNKEQPREDEDTNKSIDSKNENGNYFSFVENSVNDDSFDNDSIENDKP